MSVKPVPIDLGDIGAYCKDCACTSFMAANHEHSALGRYTATRCLRCGASYMLPYLGGYVNDGNFTEIVEPPKNIIAIYDNDGETFDRYTVYIDEEYDRNGRLKVCLGMSSNPTHPQGFSEFSGGMLGMHNGRRIQWTDLPENIQKHVAWRLGETG